MTTPTADIDLSAPRISGKSELIDWFAAGGKPKENWRIGTEHEKFGFLKDGLRPLPYEGEASVRAMLEGMRERFGWAPIIESNNIIGLSKDGASVSLEPGGQFELSGAPLVTIHETCREVGTHLDQVREIADPLGIGFLGLGFSPIWSMDETPVMPKGRYGIMLNYMPRVGRLGREMMKRTCTVQTNLDFADEADMVKKLRVSLALQPVATALFANSPFAEGRPNGFQSYRSAVWADLDPDRTGMLPFAFEEGFGFEQYVDFALDVPMYFVRRQGRYLDVAGQSFRDFMVGALPGLPGELPTMADFEDHLSTIFPEVRLKRYLEMRGADSGPWSRLCALPALWVGLLYDEEALDAAWELVRDWDWTEREGVRRSVAALGLNTPVPGRRSLRALAGEVLEIAGGGLRRRAKLNASGDDESGFLSDLVDIVRTGRTPSDVLLERYHGAWARDIRHVFREFAY